MQSKLSVFSGHLAEAYRLRKVEQDPICAAAINLHLEGVRALDVYRLVQIADKLEVSVDWLLGRSDIMELPEAKAKAKGGSPVSFAPPKAVT